MNGDAGPASAAGLDAAGSNAAGSGAAGSAVVAVTDDAPLPPETDTGVFVTPEGKRVQRVNWKEEITPIEWQMSVRELVCRFNDLQVRARQLREEFPDESDMKIQIRIVNESEEATRFCRERKRLFKLATSRKTTEYQLRELRYMWWLQNRVEKGEITQDEARWEFRKHATPKNLIEKVKQSGFWESLKAGGRAAQLAATLPSADEGNERYEDVQ
jgi:hypothetical protein